LQEYTVPFNWLITHAEIVLLSALVLIAAAFMLQQRRSPQSTAAWLLFLIAAPYIAVPIFVSLSVRKRAPGADVLHLEQIGQQAHASQIDTMLRSYHLPGATGGHDFVLLGKPDIARDALFDMVDNASEQIDALFYIVANDHVGHDFVMALTAKAQRGVRVRLVIDRLGTLNAPTSALRHLKAAGGDVRFFSPLRRGLMRGHLNLRNHRKFMVVDQKAAFGGGMNIAKEYLTSSDDAWTDLAFTLRGPAVVSFTQLFESDWRGAGGAAEAVSDIAQHGDGSAVVQLVPSGPDLRQDALHDVLVNAIHRAETRVWIATPYFLPTDGLSEALCVAGRRGVDVRILIPMTSNQKIADFARGAYLRDLQSAGCQIMLFKPGMMHSKAGILDDSAYVGSNNLDVRSMLLNFEDALFVHDTDSVSKLAQWFLDLAPDCDVGIPQASTLRRIGEGLFRIGAPIL
jgi:cardiolipin synthase